MSKSAPLTSGLNTKNENPAGLVKIGEASQLLGVSIDTLRRWEKSGKLKTFKSPGGTRFYYKNQLKRLIPSVSKNIKEFYTDAPSLPKISLSSDKQILKSYSNLSQEALLEDIELHSDKPINYPAYGKFTRNLFGILALIIISAVIFVPGYLMTGFIKDKLSQNPFSQSKNLVQSLAQLFSPKVSRILFQEPPNSKSHAPPDSLSEKLGKQANPALPRDLADLRSGILTGSNGSVLAESTQSGSYLQINLDTELNGNLGVNGQGLFTQNVTAPNLLYGVVAGTNISITGDAQTPTISTTGSSDTLQSVTERGAVTTVASIFSGGLNSSSLTLSNVLNLGQLSTDPSSASKGASYYNTTSNKLRCYISTSWQNCDTDTVGGDGDITAVSVGNGLSGGGSSGGVTIDLDVTTTSTTTTTSANSGLETASAGLSLLRGCSDTQVLRWDSTDVAWECAAAASSAVITVQEGDTTVGSSTSTLDFLGGDFDISELPGGEDNIQLAATLTTPTAVSGNWTVGGTTGLTLSGVGGQITFANGETIDNDTDDTILLNPTTLTLSGTTTLTASSLTTQTVAAAFTINGSSYVRIGDSGTPTTATSDDDLYVEGQLETDGNTIFGDAATDALTITGISAQTFTPAGTLAAATASTITITSGINDVDQTLTGLMVTTSTNSNTDSGDTINGIDIGNITASSATESALKIGSGWDNDIYFEKGTNTDVRLRVTAASGGDRTATVPALTADDTFCFATLANCTGAGGGTGVTYTSQSTNALTKFTSTSGQITSSNVSDDTTTVTIAAGINFALTSGAGTFAQTYTPSGATATANGATFTPTFGINDTDQTLSGVYVNPNTNSNTDAGDTLNGISIAAITATSSTEHGLAIGNGWDNNIYLNDTTSRVLLADGGTIVIHDGTNTLCTITDNSTVGDLSCTGSITGGSTGTQGYWTRASTTLSPSTANDIVSIATTNTTGADLAITNTGIYTGTGILNLTANSATTGNIAVLSGTGMTTGEILDLAGTWAPSNGSTNEAIDINITHTPTGSADNFQSINLTTTDGTALDNTIYNLQGTLTLIGNAAKTGIGDYQTVTSSSTTGDTLVAFDAATTVTGILAGATTRSVYGLRSQPTAGAESAAGTTNVYGLYSKAAADVAVGGTLNTYGAYIADGGGDAEGTTVNHGIYLEPITGADNNYGVCFDCDGTYSASTVASGIQFGTDANAVTLYRSASDILRTGDNLTVDLDLIVSGGDITGANGAALDIGEADDQDFTFTDNSLTLNMDFGEVTASTVTMETTTTNGNLALNANGTGDLTFTTSTGQQTFTSSNATGTTTSSGFIFDATAITSGTGTYFTSDSITQGKLVDVTTTGVTQTTGTLFNVSSVGTAFAATADSGNGLLGNFDWNPASTATGTGDLFRIRIDANGTLTSGSLFNIVDESSSIFSVNEAAFTTSLPSNFTAAGDVAIAYDVNFTNPTASYIKSQAPLAIVAGETFNSSNLTLQTYNFGTVLVDSTVTTSAAASTKYAFQINTGDTTTTADTIYGLHSTNALSGAAAKIGVGLYSTVTTSSTTSDTIIAADLATSATGIIGATTRTNTGLRTQPVSTSANTAGTQNMYGIYSAPSSTLAAGSTENVYGGYFKSTGTVASGTVNSYGVYIANPTMDTTGTARKYGLFIEDLATTGPADSNAGICFDCDGTYSSATVANGIWWGGAAETTTQILSLFRSSGAAAAQFTIEDGAGTDIVNGAADEFRINLSSADGTQGLCHDGADGSRALQLIADCAADAADLAEYFGSDGSLEPGDVVVLNGDSDGYLNENDKYLVKSFVKKSSTAYEKTTIGIISTNPFREILGERTFTPEEHKIPVALTGQVPVKVSTENGPIEKGDYLTSSTTAGVAMKATQAGAMLGRALQPYNNPGIGKIITLISTSYANPNNTLANLVFDAQGRLVIPELSAGKITLTDDLSVNGTVQASNFSLDASSLNLTGSLASIPVDTAGKVSIADALNALSNQQSAISDQVLSIDERLTNNDERITDAEQLSNLAIEQSNSLDEKVASTSANLSSLSNQITDLLASLGGNDPESTDSSGLNLTPPQQLIATDSAQFANLNVTDKVSTLNLSALDATVSATLKSLGETFLGNTVVAGDFSIDGTLAFTGNSINSLGCSNNEAMEQCSNGVLFIQNSPLAQTVDFFNGKVTINKDGTLFAQSLALGNQSVGEAVIPAGQTEITITSTLITPLSHIFITPSSPLSGNLYQDQIIPGVGVKVILSQPNSEDVKFNWLIIEEK